jgi:hypothetical protein
MKHDTIQYTIGEWWLSSLVYGDESGLSDHESAQFSEWQACVEKECTKRGYRFPLCTIELSDVAGQFGMDEISGQFGQVVNVTLTFI